MGKSRDKGDNVTSSTRNLKLTTHTTKYTEHAGFFFVFAWGDRGFKGVHIQPNPSTVPPPNTTRRRVVEARESSLNLVKGVRAVDIFKI